MNNYFNNKQLDLLKEAEEYSRQVKNGFKRNSPHMLDVKVYETLNAVEPTPEPKWSCSKCVYSLYKRASEIYFQSKEKKDERKQQENNNHTTTAPKRRGRPKDGTKRK